MKALRLMGVLLLAIFTLAAHTAPARAAIGWANTQWPPSFVGSSCSGIGIYGQVWIDGVTSIPGTTPGLTAQLGFGAPGTAPSTWPVWLNASFNVDAGNNDEFVVYLNAFLPAVTHDYAYRYRLAGDTGWTYTDLNGPEPDAPLPNPGVATIIESCGPTPVEAVTWGSVKARFRD